MNKLQAGISRSLAKMGLGMVKTAHKFADKSAWTKAVVAPRKSDVNLQLDLYYGPIPHSDPILNRETQTKAGTDYNYTYGIYEEAMDKDAHLAGDLAQRKSAVLARDRIIVPGDESERGELAAALVETCIARLTTGPGDGGFERDLGDLLDAIPMGIAIMEVIWEQASFAVSIEETERKRERTWIVPRALASRHPRRFLFDADDNLMLRTIEHTLGLRLPERKFIVFRPYARYEDPWGYAKLRNVWWLTWFKKSVTRYWIQYCERFGSPTVAGKPTQPLSDTEKTDLVNAFNDIMQETGLVLPTGVDIELIQAAQAGSILTYQEFIRYCNEEISKAIVGQVLTSSAPKGGNLSLGEVHERVALGIQNQDARALEDIINGTLIPWIIELNLPGYPLPRLQIITAPPRDIRQELDIIVGPTKGLLDTNYEVSKRWIQETFPVKRAKKNRPDDVLELTPEPQPDLFGDQPSQDPAVKTPARQRQREARRNDQSRNPGTPEQGR